MCERHVFKLNIGYKKQAPLYKKIHPKKSSKTNNLIQRDTKICCCLLLRSTAEIKVIACCVQFAFVWGIVAGDTQEISLGFIKHF